MLQANYMLIKIASWQYCSAK